MTRRRRCGLPIQRGSVKVGEGGKTMGGRTIGSRSSSPITAPGRFGSRDDFCNGHLFWLPRRLVLLSRAAESIVRLKGRRRAK